VSLNEQGYIQALAKRYSADPKADRKHRALAYKTAIVRRQNSMML